MGMLLHRHNPSSTNEQPKVQVEKPAQKVEIVEEKVSTKKIKKSAK